MPDLWEDVISALMRRLRREPALTMKELPAWGDREGVSPLLYHAFERRGWPASLSVTTFEHLRRSHFENAARNIGMLSTLDDLCGRLRDEGRDRPVVFKGADLATGLYPNVALRPMGDVDLWVPTSDISAAEQILEDLGFRPWGPEMVPGLARNVRHARVFVGGPGDSIAVDLHWSLVANEADRRAPAARWFQRNLRTHASEPWRVLSNEARLLYLAAHAKLQHAEDPTPLIWLIDFYLASGEPGLDWEALGAAAHLLDWTAPLETICSDVERSLGIALPAPLQRLARRRREGKAACRPGLAPTPIARIWRELLTLDWKRRGLLLRALVLPSPAYVRWRYAPRPSWIWPLYYPRRWLSPFEPALALGHRVLRKLVPRTRPPLYRAGLAKAARILASPNEHRT